MSSRIIRGDSRMPKLKVSAGTTGMTAAMSEDHIMDVEKQAFEQGYAEGERIGKQMGEAMIETICKRYEKALADLALSHKQMAESMEEHTVRLSLEIARKIVQRELTMDRDLVTALATVALKRTSSHQSITLRISRNDLPRVSAAIGSVNPAVVVTEDPSLERGDFLIQTGQTHVDGRLSSQVDIIGRALLGD